MGTGLRAGDSKMSRSGRCILQTERLGKLGRKAGSKGAGTKADDDILRPTGMFRCSTVLAACGHRGVKAGWVPAATQKDVTGGMVRQMNKLTISTGCNPLGKNAEGFSRLFYDTSAYTLTRTRSRCRNKSELHALTEIVHILHRGPSSTQLHRSCSVRCSGRNTYLRNFYRTHQCGPMARCCDRGLARIRMHIGFISWLCGVEIV